MMKYIQPILIVALILTCGYLYMDNQKTMALCSRNIEVLEAAGRKYQEDCETRLAFLKAEKDREIADIKAGSEIHSLHGIVDKLSAKQEQELKDVFREMSVMLGLDEKQEFLVRAVMADFEKAKALVFEKNMQENIFILDPVHIDRINETRRIFMEKLGSVLSEAQLKAFNENDFDLKFGLREMKHAPEPLQ